MFEPVRLFEAAQRLEQSSVDMGMITGLETPRRMASILEVDRSAYGH